jgi:acetate---CoA ligase (ADP-forming)
MTGVLGLAPLRPEDAHRLLRRLRGYDLLAGARGGHAVDLDSLSALICAVGNLHAGVPEIVDLDLDPVLATASGCVAVDQRRSELDDAIHASE